MNLNHESHYFKYCYAGKEPKKNVFLMSAKKIAGISLYLLLLTFPVLAQSDHSTNLFGGYSYFHIDGNVKSVNTNGWHTNLSTNLFKNFGIAVDVSGHYGALDQHTFQVGPRISNNWKKVSVFSQYLYGIANQRGRFREFGIPIDKNSKTFFAESFGGGLDINLSDKLAIRAFQSDIVFNHPVKKEIYMNVRFSTGVVFRLHK